VQARVAERLVLLMAEGFWEWLGEGLEMCRGAGCCSLGSRNDTCRRIDDVSVVIEVVDRFASSALEIADAGRLAVCRPAATEVAADLVEQHAVVAALYS